MSFFYPQGERKKKEQKSGNGGFFAHNSRERKTVNSIFSDEENFYSCDSETAFKIYRKELKIRTEKYTERTGQKLQKKAITHLSAIVNLNQNHNEDDLKKICDYLEKELDTKIIQFAVHKDEGHILNDATDEVRRIHSLLHEDENIKNYHGHIEFLGLDSQGVSVRKKLTKKFLSNLQTQTAKLLKMDRGNSSTIDNVQEFYKQIKNEMPVTDNLKDFKKEWIKTGKEIKYREKPKTRRQDTYDYKDTKEAENRALSKNFAKQTDLKREIAELRLSLKESGATRQDYAKLEQVNKDLKIQVKLKTLDIKELHQKLENLKNELISEKETNKDIQSTNDMVLTQNKTLQEQNIDLLEEVVELNKKIDSSGDMSDLKKKINDYEDTFEKLDKILLTADEKTNDIYLKNSELIERVETIKNENNWFKDRFTDLNRLFEKPKDTFREIFEAVKAKIETGYENIFEKVKSNSIKNFEKVRDSKEKMKDNQNNRFKSSRRK